MANTTAVQIEALKRELATLRATLATRELCRQRYQKVFDAARVAYAVAEIIVDERGQPCDYRLIDVNDTYGAITGLPCEVASGKTAREVDPDIDLHWIETYGNVALSGQSVRFELESPSGRRLDVFAFCPAPGQFMHVFVDITQRKEVEDKLEEQLRFFQTLLDAIPVPIFYKDGGGIYQGGNRAFATYLGFPLESIIGHSVYDIAPKHLADIYKKADEDLLTRGGFQTYEARVRNADGSERDVAFYKATFMLADRATTGLIGMIFDISERKRVERGLRKSEGRYRRQATELEAVYGSAPIGLAVLDRELRYQRINESLAKLNGKPREAHLGRTVREMVPMIAGTAEKLGREVFTTGEPVLNFEYRIPHNGRETERFYLTHWLPLKDEWGRVWGINVVLEDTTEQKRSEEQARHMAQHDPLTDLPNRRLLLELVDAELRKARRAGYGVALLFLDLDRFKTINDTLGHESGDALLKAVANRLTERIRQSDVVARLGGDEFTILLPIVGRGEQAGEVAESILEAFKVPYQLGNQLLYITASVGISLYPADGADAGVLLRCADAAMYDAKEHGRNTIRFYNPTIGHRAQERLRIEHRLREALERGGLRLFYQPEIDLRTGQVMGVEALVRWHHPELGLLDPARFIPLAEETDLIAAVDDWVLRTACAQARAWLEQGHSIYIGVNLSSKRFENPNLVETVHRCMTEQGLTPQHLELELTERTVMRHMEQTVDRMKELVSLGVTIAVDDFGTGYSSLNYLKRLPFSKLKIDRSFVQDIATDEDDRAIVQAMTALAHTMNKRVIAEGVETEAQRDFLNATGCDEAQGFLYAVPLPPERLGTLLPH